MHSDQGYQEILKINEEFGGNLDTLNEADTSSLSV